MDLHQLRLFRALAGTGSFSKAAAVCHISQPALWIHIKKLESALNTALVDRLPRGIELTETGRLVLDYAVRVFSLLDEMNMAVVDLAGLKRGKMLIGASTTPGIYILPGVLGKFKRQYPEIEMNLRIANTQQVEEWILNRELILGIIGQEPSNPDLRWEPYLRESLVAILPAGHSLSKRKTISLRDLSTEPFLMREPGSNTRKTCEEAFRKNRVSVRVTMELGSTEAIKRAVMAKLGVSIVSPHAIDSELQQRKIIALRIREAGFQRQFNLIYHRQRRIPNSVQVLAEMLRAPKKHLKAFEESASAID